MFIKFTNKKKCNVYHFFCYLGAIFSLPCGQKWISQRFCYCWAIDWSGFSLKNKPFPYSRGVFILPHNMFHKLLFPSSRRTVSCFYYGQEYVDWSLHRLHSLHHCWTLRTSRLEAIHFRQQRTIWNGEEDQRLSIYQTIHRYHSLFISNHSTR